MRVTVNAGGARVTFKKHEALVHRDGETAAVRFDYTSGAKRLEALSKVVEGVVQRLLEIQREIQRAKALHPATDLDEIIDEIVEGGLK